jgi:hypothetical protein
LPGPIRKEAGPRRAGLPGHVSVGQRELHGDDDLAILVVAAVRAHVMRKLRCTALWANGTSRSGELAVGRTTSVRGAATLFLLRYCHLDLSLTF